MMSQILTTLHDNNFMMCYPHQTSLLDSMCCTYIIKLYALVLQVTVIKNLAEEEKKDAKAFLKQQPFAKPGNHCEKLHHIPTHNRFYRLSCSVTGSMGTVKQRL